MPGNLVQVAEQLKGAPDQFLQQESQQPSGYAPPFLILGEISRRQQLRKSSQAQAPTTTVAQDLMQAAAPPPMPPGMPPGMMPQGPPSVGLGALMQQQMPIRMARGGAVPGMYASLPTGNWLENSVFATLPQRTPYDEEEERRKRMYATPEGYVIGGVLFPKLPNAPAFEARPPEPIHIEEPAIEPLIERARALQSAPTSTYESRVAELEQERKKVKGPDLGDLLIQTGLGSMASRSPFAFQGFGESALNAFKDVTARRDYANEQRRGIASQIANVRMAGEQEDRRREQQNIDLASAMQQRLHGQAVTEAQAQMQYSGQVEAARRAAYEQQQENLRAGHRYNTQLATTQLEQLSKISPFDPRYKEQKEWEANLRQRHALELEAARHAGDMAERAVTRRQQLSDLQRYENAQNKASNLDSAVKAMVDTEVRKGYHDFKNQDAGDILDISRRNIAENLMKPEYFQDIPVERRLLLRQRVLAWSPNKDYREGLEEKIGKWGALDPKDEQKNQQKRMTGALPIPDLNEAAGGPEGVLPNYLPPRAAGGATPTPGPVTTNNGTIRMDADYITGYKPGQEDKKKAPAVTAPTLPSVGLAASPHLQPSSFAIQAAPLAPALPPAPPRPVAAPYVPSYDPAMFPALPAGPGVGLPAGLRGPAEPTADPRVRQSTYTPSGQPSTVASYSPPGPAQAIQGLNRLNARLQGRLSANRSDTLDPNDRGWQENAESYAQWLERMRLGR